MEPETSMSTGQILVIDQTTTNSVFNTWFWFLILLHTKSQLDTVLRLQA